MKKIYLTLCLLSLSLYAGAQCTATVLYPSLSVTPYSVWTDVTYCNFAGEYALVNVTAGNLYEFSTCAANGSTITYDTQLTLRTNSFGFIAYSDDYCGTQSYVSWTATYTGQVQIHLHEDFGGFIGQSIPCSSNSICSNIRMKVTSGAPANNDCANATILAVNTSCLLTSGTTSGATEDPILDPSCNSGSINDVWYTFNSGANTSVNVTVNLVTAYEVGIEVFSACGTLAPGISIGGALGNCDWDASAPNPTVITGLTPNMVYRFRLFTNITIDIAGSFTVCLTVPTPPANNDCANATILAVNTSCLLTSGTTSGATEDPILDPSCNSGSINDVWYTFNSGANTSVNVTVNLVTASVVNIEVFSACGTLAPGISLGGVVGNCYWITFAPNPTVASGLTPNTVYRFRLFTNFPYDIAGSFTVCLTVPPPPPPPTVSIDSASICPGASTTLTATPSTLGGTYLWSPGGQTTQSITVSPLTTTTYSVTYTLNGTGTNSSIVTVYSPPAINAGLDISICSGQPATLTGSGGVSYTWNNGVTNNLPFNPLTTATYTVTGTDLNGCTGTDQMIVTVNANPVPAASINLSGSVVLTASPAGMSYQWINCGTGQEIADATGASYTATYNGSYAVIVTNANGCSDTSNCEIVNSVGLSDVSAATVGVYPNPSSGIFNVFSEMEISFLEILDLKGAVIYSSKPNGNLATLDLRFQADGIYVLKLRTPQNTSYFRIVKN